MAEPVIIEAAINGVTSKERNPNMPASRPRSRPTRSRASPPARPSCTTTSTSFGVAGQRAPPSATSRAGGRSFGERPDAILYPTIERRRRRRGSLRAHRAARRVGRHAHGHHRSRLGEPRRPRTRTGFPAAGDFVYANTSATSATARDCASATARSEHRDLRAGFLRTALAFTGPGACRAARW